MGRLFDTTVLTTAYFPPVEYFFAIANSGQVLIEQHEAYQKQSWRNRCRILSAAGPEDLSIPVVKEERLSRPIRDIRIDYGEPWLQHHIRALSAAYNHSAFYDYYADDLLPILESKPAFLFDLNMALLEKLLALLALDTPVSLTDSFIKDYSSGGIDALASWGEVRAFVAAGSRHERTVTSPPGQPTPALPSKDVKRSRAVLDGRSRIQPKYKGESLLAEYDCQQAYYQVFVNRDPSLNRDPSRHAGLDPASSFIPNLSILDLLAAEGPDAADFFRI